MTDYKPLYRKLKKNLRILQERKAKYAGNAPLELINQINDYETTITLTSQVITGDLDEDTWKKALKPLLIDVNLIKIISSQDSLQDFQMEQDWILVAGLGEVNLLPDHKEVYYASLVLGKLLAREGFGLLVGGWDGVDYIVADEFHKKLKEMGKPLSEHLLQVVPENTLPKFHGGQVIHTKAGWLEWQNIVQKSDAIILLGGEGGTYQTYKFAQMEQKPVFPLAGTKDDAQRVFNEILANWDDEPMGNVTLAMFTKTLSQPIDTEEKAQKVAQDVIELIKHRLQKNYLSS